MKKVAVLSGLIIALVIGFCAVSCVGKDDLQEEDKPIVQPETDQEAESQPEPDPAPDPTPEPVPDTTMTVRFVSYNVGKFSKHESFLGHKSYPEVARVIQDIKGAVIGLNETNKGQAAELAAALGRRWTSYFAYAANSNYGNSIVAAPQYEVVKEYDRVAIPKMDEMTGEVRSLGVVEYEDFVFCVTHLDHKSIASRKHGVEVITEWCLDNYGPGKTTKPVILLGDMNCLPTEETITMFLENWDWVSANEYTFPCPNPTKCIDFVFVLRNGVPYTKGESHSVFDVMSTDIEKASDHYPIYADITFNVQK